MTHYKITLLLIILPSLRNSPSLYLSLTQACLIISALILLVFYPSLGSHKFLSYLPGVREGRQESWLETRSPYWVCMQPHRATLRTNSRKRLTTCQNMPCGLCRFRGRASSLTAVGVMIRPEHLSATQCWYRDAKSSQHVSMFLRNNVIITMPYLHVTYKTCVCSGNSHQRDDIRFINLRGFLRALVMFMSAAQ